MASAHDASSETEFGANDWLIDEMYERYTRDPHSVDQVWQTFFAERGRPETAAPAVSKTESAPPAQRAAKPPAPTPAKLSAQPAAPAAKPAAASADTAARKSTVEAPNEVKDTRPTKPGTSGGVPADPPNPAQRPTATATEPERTRLRGAPMRTAKNMDASLSVPTATSVRTIPMKLVIEQRTLINNHLKRARGGKISFTHLIGYAIVQAIKSVPAMKSAYEVVDGKPTLVTPGQINLGLAIDISKPDGTRQLLVPSIKDAGSLDFAQFWAAYEALVAKARTNTLTVDDFAGTTVSLTNPGPMGTHHSVPRLMTGQGTIVGMGAINYPPEFEGADAERLAEMGVGRICTLTSTYDHRVIQGAQSGEFLNRIHQLLLGADRFWDDIFRSLRVPMMPVRWNTDISAHRDDKISKQARVLELINAYRTRGHLLADIDPLEYHERGHLDLETETHSLTLWDMDREFATGSFGGPDKPFMKLRDILDVLRDSYCRTIGIEYMHISDPEQRKWIQERVEQPFQDMPREEHLRILGKLNEAEIFETFLQTKFVGQKRFSLEGGESAIVLLDEICDLSAQRGLDEVCIGMPHRGRLNVLANIVGKSYGQIFREFEGNIDPRTVQGSGDVKYHLGAEGHFEALNGATVRTSVAANPSHLEAVNPVLEGITRAKQDILDRSTEFPVLPILMHGDASFAGQGVVVETLQMSQLRGYRTGGTIHVVVNNQVGFTTSPTESRSSYYATDVAKTINAPIFHVNGDDPEACIRVARLAFEFRQAFNKDVVIDLVCYRRRGHNEGDDPSFTQPLMYDLIENKRSARKLYTESLIGRGLISVEDAEDVLTSFQQRLESVFKELRDPEETEEEMEDYRRVPAYPAKSAFSENTAISRETMKAIADAYVNFPDGFSVHPKVLPQLQRRAGAIMQGPIDWATAEILALGSLLMDGRPVRLTGQDSRRGTFSQRFAAVIDRVTGESWVPLKHLSDHQGKFMVFDSLLSEYAAMGFEYGYSVARPDAVVLWEAQFGDFANGAQTIIDEFISSGQAKWTQKSGVVLLLPHGYEGQGPDHSSARIERFLQLAAEDAFSVAVPSTPSSYFHLLRTHARVNWHRPLVVATPKSMLRNKAAVSMPEDFTDGSWQPVLADPTITDPSKVTTVLICSGKIRWDLVAERERAGRNDEVAIVTLERLYPLATKELIEALKPYGHVRDIRFVQEEPANQGAWPFVRLNLIDDLIALAPDRDWNIRGITRPASSAPSVGTLKVHVEEQKALVAEALDTGR